MTGRDVQIGLAGKRSVKNTSLERWAVPEALERLLGTGDTENQVGQSEWSRRL
jgi:hypothetical protein